MYMNRQITVNLTAENQGKLEQPAKMFNKVKATFTQGMTPAEASRAQVMLSVLQRVNKSLRSVDICNLVSLAVNEQTIYYDEKGIEGDLKQGVLSFRRDKRQNNTRVFKRLQQIVEHTTQGILFVYEINVLQKPKAGAAPVTITVSGFPSQFKLQPDEQSSDFASRINGFVKQNLSNGEQVTQLNEQYLKIFEVEVERFLTALDSFFPAGCSTEKEKMRLLNNSDQLRLKQRIGGYFEPDIIFMEYWLNAEDIANFDDGSECDDLYDSRACEWSDDESSASTENSWLDNVSESFSDFSSGESNCGSSCGSSCGGD